MIRDEHLVTDEGTPIGQLVTAAPALVQFVLTAPEDDDGRSPWYWLRLANGDLMLACFPCGLTYENTDLDPNRP